MDQTLAGRVVVVTGSAGGIGRVIAERAAAAGAAVVVNSRRAERLDAVTGALKALGGPYLAVAANVRDPDEVERLVQETVRAFGRIDVWVNNAAGVFFQPAEQISPNGWRAIIDTNLTAPFLCARAVFPVMRAQGKGRIINIGSVAADGPHPWAAHYGAAKAGLANLTATLAYEWAPYGIQVNCVEPGPILTEASRFQDPRIAESVRQLLPGGQLGRPEDVAEVVLFLASMAGTYLTGETIRVDGCLRRPLPPPDRAGAP